MISLDKIVDIGYSIEKNISIDCFFKKTKKMPRKMKKDFKKLYGFKN